MGKENKKRKLRIKLRHHLEGVKYGWFLPDFSLINKLKKKLNYDKEITV